MLCFGFFAVRRGLCGESCAVITLGLRAGGVVVWWSERGNGQLDAFTGLIVGECLASEISRERSFRVCVCTQCGRRI